MLLQRQGAASTRGCGGPHGHAAAQPPVVVRQYAACVAPRRQQQAQQQSLQICRITNTSSEIYKARGVPEPDPEQEEILVNEIQVHHPELGILENRVQKQYLQELFQDTGVDLEETAYWFHTPPGGWNSQLTKVRPAQEAPVTFPEPHHENTEDDDRIMLGDLDEGEVFTGVITDCWLYHGIQVDIGAEFDGLVPISQEIWQEEPSDPAARSVREALLPGDEVQVRVYKVRQPGLYRWPLQLELLAPADVAARMDPPEAYEPPIDHGWCAEQGWSPEEISEATDRYFFPSTFYIGEDQANYGIKMEMAYGYDDPDSNFYYEDPKTPYLLGQGQVLIDNAMMSL